MTLKESISNKGLNRKRVAEMVNVSYRALNSYVYGTRRPSPEIAEKFGEILGLSKAELWDMFYAKPVNSAVASSPKS
jgi:predicted transcriptional regulator